MTYHEAIDELWWLVDLILTYANRLWMIFPIAMAVLVVMDWWDKRGEPNETD